MYQLYNSNLKLYWGGVPNTLRSMEIHLFHIVKYFVLNTVCGRDSLWSTFYGVLFNLQDIYFNSHYDLKLWMAFSKLPEM